MQSNPPEISVTIPPYHTFNTGFVLCASAKRKVEPLRALRELRALKRFGLMRVLSENGTADGANGIDYTEGVEPRRMNRAMRSIYESLVDTTP